MPAAGSGGRTMALKVRGTQGQDEEVSDAMSATAGLYIEPPQDGYVTKVGASDCRSCMGRGFKYVSSRRPLWALADRVRLRIRPCLDCGGDSGRSDRPLDAAEQ